MGIVLEVAEVPDTFGLVEYFITDVAVEIDGAHVRMVCGARRGGVIHWLYSCVMSADKLVICSKLVNSAAQEAFVASGMMGQKALVRGH